MYICVGSWLNFGTFRNITFVIQSCHIVQNVHELREFEPRCCMSMPNAMGVAAEQSALVMSTQLLSNIDNIFLTIYVS